MIYEAKNYYDAESAIVYAAETTMGIEEISERFSDQVTELHRLFMGAVPVARTALLELFAEQADEYSFWNVHAYHDDVTQRAEDLTGLSNPERVVLESYMEIKREHYEKRAAVVERPRVRKALAKGADTCRQQIDFEAAEKEMQQSTHRLRRFQEAMAVIETIEQNAMTNGYELEIIKRHFYSAIKTLDSLGVLKIKNDHEAVETPEEARVNFLMKQYQRRCLPDVHLVKQGEVDTEEPVEDPVFVDDETVGDYFVHYFKHAQHVKNQASCDYFASLLASSSIPIPYHVYNTNEAAEELIIVGSVPERLEPDELFTFLGESIPEAVLAACREIKFRPFSNQEAKLLDDDGLDTDLLIEGLWLGNGAAEINTRHILTPERLRHVVTHEIAHGLLKTLAIGDLHAFEMARESDAVDVTEYVTFNKEHFPYDAPSEDFAESFALYFNNPLDLRTKSPARYKVLAAIVKSLEITQKHKEAKEQFLFGE